MAEHSKNKTYICPTFKNYHFMKRKTRMVLAMVAGLCFSMNLFANAGEYDLQKKS